MFLSFIFISPEHQQDLEVEKSKQDLTVDSPEQTTRNIFFQDELSKKALTAAKNNYILDREEENTQEL